MAWSVLMLLACSKKQIYDERMQTFIYSSSSSVPAGLRGGSSINSYKWFVSLKCHLLQTLCYKDLEALWYESALNRSQLPCDHHLRSNTGRGRQLRHTYTHTHTHTQFQMHSSLFLSKNVRCACCVCCVCLFLCLLFSAQRWAPVLLNNKIWLEWFQNGRAGERERERLAASPSERPGKHFSSPQIPDVQLSQTAISWSQISSEHKQQAGILI